MHRFVLALTVLLLAACGSDNPAGPGGGDTYAVRVVNLGTTQGIYSFHVAYRVPDGEERIVAGGTVNRGATWLDPFLFSPRGAVGAAVRYEVHQGNIRVELLRGAAGSLEAGQGTVVASGEQAAPGRIDLSHGQAPPMQ